MSLASAAKTASQATWKYARPALVRRLRRIQLSKVCPSSTSARRVSHGRSRSVRAASRAKRSRPWPRSASANGDSRGTAPLSGFIVDRLPCRSSSNCPSSFQVRNVDSPSSPASSRMRVWPSPSHCPPSSSGVPSSSTRPSVRPPTRSRASTTVTSCPRATSRRAAASPASPAPTTMTVLIRLSPRAAVAAPGTASAYHAVLPHQLGHPGRAALGGLFCHPGVLRTRLTRGEHDDPTAVRTRERRGHAALGPRYGRRGQRGAGCPAGSRADPARPGSGARRGVQHLPGQPDPVPGADQAVPGRQAGARGLPGRRHQRSPGRSSCCAGWCPHARGSERRDAA